MIIQIFHLGSRDASLSILTMSRSHEWLNRSLLMTGINFTIFFSIRSHFSTRHSRRVIIHVHVYVFNSAPIRSIDSIILLHLRL
jgi:hypothetical protein